MGTIHLEHCGTEDMVADVLLTKALACAMYNYKSIAAAI